jgi:cytosine/adenosine deaminase-related metal-dependent hydrolase
MRVTLFAPALAWVWAAALGAQTVALTGTVVLPDGAVEHGTVVIDEGRIIASGANVTAPKDAKVIAIDGVIAPGFIDLHNHLTYNVLPRWKPNEEFGNRYEWQQKPVYGELISAPHAEMSGLGLECEEERYAELKAIAQGETAVVGSVHGCSLDLDRELDVDPRLGAGLGRIINNVFPLEMTEAALADAKAALSATPRVSLLIHVSEGSPHDAAAAREFTMFKARGLMRPGVSVIHGVAIPAFGFAEMAKAGVGLVWSPRSNIELYGDTANVAAAKGAGVTMALAPDWSPTGSVGMLGELGYASVWNQGQRPASFTERELVEMATANPAKLVGLEGQIGSLAAGHAADIVVVRRTRPDAFAALTHAAPEDVLLVMIGGEAVYGDPELLKTATGHAGERVKVCGVEKAFSAEARFAATEAKLAPALRQVGRGLAALAECGD